MSAQDELLIALNAQDHISSVLQSIDGHVATFGTKLESAGQKGQGMFGRIAEGAASFLTAGVIQNVAGQIGGLFTDGIGKAADFDQQMSKIKATTGETGPRLESLRQTALNLGMATDVGSVSASDAANAIFELGKAGVSVDAINAGVAKSTLQLAAAAGPEFGVANAAALAADSMNTFGLSAKDSGLIVNTLVGAANASSIGLGELKQSLAAVGPVANLVGMNVTDFNVAMAEFGMHGLKGADAGTSLKTMLLNLQPSTKSATAQMLDLGLITADGTNLFFDQAGKVKDLATVQQILQDHLHGLNAAEQEHALKVMFGTDAVRAAAIMAGEGAKGADEYAAAVKKQGDAAAASATMSDNLKGKWEALTGTIDTIKIQLGSVLLPVLGQVADSFNHLAGDVMTAFSSGDWTQVGADIQGGLQAAMNVVGQWINGGGLQALLTNLQSWGAALWGWIGPQIPTVLGKIAEWEGSVLSWFVTTGLPWLWEKTLALGKALWEWVSPQIEPALRQLAEWGRQIAAWVLDTGLPWLWDKVTQLGKALIDWIGPRIEPTLRQLAAWGQQLGDWIMTTGLPLLWGKLSELGQQLVDWIGPQIPPMLRQIGEWLGQLTTWIVTEGIPKLVGTLLGMAFKLVSWIADAIPKAQEAIRDFFSHLFQSTNDQGPQAHQTFLEMAGSMLQGLVDGITNLQHTVRDALVTMWNNLVSSFKDAAGIHSPSTVFMALAGHIVDGLLQGLQNSWHLVTDKLHDLAMQLPEPIRNALGIHSPSQETHDLGTFIVQGLVNGITEGQQTVGQALTGIATSITTWGTNVKQEVQTAWGNIQTTFTNGATAVHDALIPVFGPGGTIMLYLFGHEETAFFALLDKQTHDHLEGYAIGTWGAQLIILNDRVADKLGDLLSTATTGALAAGTAIGQGIESGISSMVEPIAQAARAAVEAAIAAANDAAQIHSPSRRFAQIGAYMGQGMADGMTGQQPTVARAGAGLAGAAAGGAQGQIRPALAGGAAGTGGGAMSLLAGATFYLSVNGGPYQRATVDVAANSAALMDRQRVRGPRQ